MPFGNAVASLKEQHQPVHITSIFYFLLYFIVFFQEGIQKTRCILLKCLMIYFFNSGTPMGEGEPMSSPAILVLFFIMGPEGFEPPTLEFVAPYSIQLSYGPFLHFLARFTVQRPKAVYHGIGVPRKSFLFLQKKLDIPLNK